MRTCATCAFWDEDHSEKPNWGMCRLTVFHFGIRADYPDSKALAYDPALDPYLAYLLTASDFACNQWKRQTVAAPETADR